MTLQVGLSETACDGIAVIHAHRERWLKGPNARVASPIHPKR